MKRKLVLENGMEFIGEGFGSNNFNVGEVVFTTGMTGYQETISDPSFHKQIIVFTYPLIGNYGVNASDFESLNPFVGGVVMHEFTKKESHWQSEKNIEEYFIKQNIPGLAGIDTRALTKVIRDNGIMKGRFCEISENTQKVVEELKKTELKNHVAEVSIPRAYAAPGGRHRVVVIDYGMKKSFLKELSIRDCDVIVVPFDTDSKTILELNPNGILLSDGPGNPEELTKSVQTIKELGGSIPIFGISLGHQVYALANGAKIGKLKFGHRGANHPVRSIVTNRVHITSQNHTYIVEEESLKNTDLEITHKALNDGTIEGLKHKTFPAFTVQFLPESSFITHSEDSIFNYFMDMMEKFKNK